MKQPHVGLIWEISRVYGNDAIRGVADYAHRYGPWLFSLSQHGDLDVNHLRQASDLDGILLCHDYREAVEAIEWPANIPIVSLERTVSAVTPWQVLPDNVAVGRLVAEEFLKRGFRNLAYCQDTSSKQPTMTWESDRFEGFSQVARRAGIDVLMHHGMREPWGHYDQEWKDGRLVAWLRSLPKPVGVMAPSDIRCRHVLISAEMAGLRVPEEVAVIGVNNEPWAQITAQGMSCVELDGYRAGYAAAELLHRLINGQAVKREIIRIPPRRLIIRRSSDALAIDDPDVVTAVRFIAANAAFGIDVQEVVDAVPLSRRVLERRFRHKTGRSILDEIRLVRIARAKNLLVDETIPLQRVAQMSGFSSAKAMGAVFRRDVKTTPTAYRARLRRSNDGQQLP